MNGYRIRMPLFDMRKHRPEVSQTCLFALMTQGSIARIIQIPKMQMDQTSFRPIFVSKTAPVLILIGRNLVSAFKIELVTPIGISVHVDLVQPFEIVLPDGILWIKAPVKAQNAI